MTIERDAFGRFKAKTPQMVKAAAQKAPQGPVATQMLSACPPTFFGKNYLTAQIYSMGFEFALMGPKDDGYQQATTFAYCKDFFHDAVWAHVNQTAWQVYGFKYTPAKDPALSDDHCVFAFRNTKYKARMEEFHVQRAACQEFLNGFEAKAGLAPSQIFEVENEGGPCWLIVGDKQWQIAPPMLGLYTLLIRVGFAHTLGQPYETTLDAAKAGNLKIGESSYGYAGNNDCSYIQSSWDFVQKVLEIGAGIFHPTIADNYPVGLKVHGLHDNFGPVAFQNGLGKKTATCHKAMPFWYRPEIWGGK